VAGSVRKGGNSKPTHLWCLVIAWYKRAGAGEKGERKDNKSGTEGIRGRRERKMKRGAYR